MTRYSPTRLSRVVQKMKKRMLIRLDERLQAYRQAAKELGQELLPPPTDIVVANEPDDYACTVGYHHPKGGWVYLHFGLDDVVRRAVATEDWKCHKRSAVMSAWANLKHS